MITTGTKTAFGYIQYGWGVLTKNMDTQLKGAIRTAVHSKHFKAIEGKGFVAGNCRGCGKCGNWNCG